MENKLIIKNDFSQLILEDQTVFKSIYNALRFRKEGYFHSPAYKLFIRTKGKKGWDGFVDFFHKEKGKFGTGLLPEIVSALAKLGTSVCVEDERTELIQFNAIEDNILSDFEDRFGEPIVLYDFQAELANKAIQYERGIISAKTASGKTLMFSAILKAMKKQVPTLLIFREKTLAQQTAKRLTSYGIENVGIITGENYEPNLILCATIQSLHKFEKLLQHFEFLIVDEVHQFATDEGIELFKNLPRCRQRLGFSATPWNPNDKLKKYRIKSHIGPILGTADPEHLRELKILSDAKCYFHKIDKPDVDIENYKDAYKLGITLNPFAHEKIKEIVDSYESGRILIVVEYTEHGDEIKKMFPDAFWVQGKDTTETRKYVIEKLCNSDPGQKNVAIATRIFQTGIDLFVHGLINAAGFKSYIMTLQRIGRGLRTAPDKKYLDYHDFYYTNSRYLEDHSKKRMKWLKDEGHEVNIVNEVSDIIRE